MPIAAGTEFVSNSVATNNQDHPAIAVLADGRIFMVWHSEDAIGDSNGIRGRLFWPDGTPAANDFQVNDLVGSTGQGEQFGATILALADGNFLVTWTSDGSNTDGDGEGYSIVGRMFSADGTALTGNFIVNTTTTGNQTASAATLLSNGNILVTWQSGFGSSARLLSSSGEPLGLEFTLNQTSVISQYTPHVTALEGGGFFVTWQSWLYDTVEGALYDDTGALVSPSHFQINTTSVNAVSKPQVTELADGRILVTWTSFNDPSDSTGCIRGRILSADGTPVANDFMLSTTTSGPQQDVAVASLADGRFVAVWGSSDNGDGNGSCIRARIFNLDGTSDASDFIVNVSGVGGQAHPSVSALADGRFVVSWTDGNSGTDGSGSGIRHRIFDPTTFNGTSGADLWRGGSLADRIFGGAGADTLHGGDGADTISGDADNDLIYGGDGNDTILDSGGGADIQGEGGNDRITVTGTGNSFADAGIGDDTMIGGGAGNKFWTPGTGRDEVYGGSGSDFVNVAAGDLEAGEIYSGGAGSDDLTLAHFAGTSTFDLRTVTITSFESIASAYAGDLTVQMYSSQLGSSFTLRDGNILDITLDQTTFAGSTKGFGLYANTGQAHIRVIGTSAAETIDWTPSLTPGTFNVTLDGGGGNDSITAGNNGVTFIGGTGKDTLVGGTSADTFIVNEEDVESGEVYDGGTVGSAADANTMLLRGTDGYYAIYLNETTISNISVLRLGDAHSGTNVGNAYVKLTYTQMLGFTDIARDAAATGLGVWFDVDITGHTNVSFETLLDNMSTADRALQVLGTELAETIVGTAGSDYFGASGTTMSVAGAADLLTGGSGDDTYYLGRTGSTVVEFNGAAGGTDTIYSEISFTLPENVEALFLDLGAVNGTGNSGANSISGTDANNVLDGLGGEDTVFGYGGDDTLVVRDGDFIINIDAEVYDGGDDTDTLRITGYAPNYNVDITDFTLSNIERLELAGGTGITVGQVILTASQLAAMQTVIATPGSGPAFGATVYVQLAGSTGSSFDFSGLDIASLVGNTANRNFTFNSTAAAETIVGTATTDYFVSNGGADRFTGGGGNDQYFLGSNSSVVTILEGSGVNSGLDIVYSSVSRTLANNIEVLHLEGSGHITGTGNAGVNTIEGTTGNNTLDGLGSNDVLVGYAGSDTYVLGNDDDLVGEAASGGTDTITSTKSRDLNTFSEVENLTLLGTAASGIGNGAANKIVGNDAANTINGGGAKDTMEGGKGDDTYTADRADDVVTETSIAGGGNDLVNFAGTTGTFTLGTFIERLTLGGTSGIHGSGNGLANTMTGNSGGNTLKGLAGNDTIDGKGGVDRLEGGDGSDTYTVDRSTDVVVEATAAIATGGNDLVYFAGTTGTFILGDHLERLTLSGSSAIHGTGNGLANTLMGNSANNILKGLAGNDTIDGAGGTDTMEGGDGSDTYTANLATDIVTETNAAAAGGNDLVIFTGASGTFTLGNHIERLTLGGGSTLSGKGNTLGNTLIGNGAANTLNGLTGKDTMTGGLGADKFVFSTALAAANVDTITDFSRAEGDKIHLDNAVMAALVGTSLGSQFYAAVDAANGNDANDRIVYNITTGALYYDANANGAGGLTQIAVLSNKFVLFASDFAIV